MRARKPIPVITHTQGSCAAGRTRRFIRRLLRTAQVDWRSNRDICQLSYHLYLCTQCESVSDRIEHMNMYTLWISYRCVFTYRFTYCNLYLILYSTEGLVQDFQKPDRSVFYQCLIFLIRVSDIVIILHVLYGSLGPNTY